MKAQKAEINMDLPVLPVSRPVLSGSEAALYEQLALRRLRRVKLKAKLRRWSGRALSVLSLFKAPEPRIQIEPDHVAQWKRREPGFEDRFRIL